MKYTFVLLMFVIQFAAGQSSMLKKEIPAQQTDLSFLNAPPSLSTIEKNELLPYQGEGAYEKKKVSLAVLYSLLLPGMGELYVGDYTMGKYFTIAEGGLWITFGAVKWYANGLQDDARQFAVQHAGISLDGKEDQYFVDIAEFDNANDFNEQILRNRDAHKVYDAQSFYWNWDNDANRQQFSDLRESSDARFNDVRFVVAAIGINHIISAINAGRLAIAHNKSVDDASLLHINAGLIGDLANPSGIQISISKNF